jgi:hypothetical protein
MQKVVVNIKDLDSGQIYNVPKSWLTWSKKCQLAFGRCSDQHWFNLMDQMPQDYPKDTGPTENLYWLLMDTDYYTVVN